MANYASAGGAYGVGIPALALGSLAFLQNGGLGNIFGNNQAAEKDAKIARLEAEKYTDGVAAQIYKASRDEKDALGDRLLEKYINPMATTISAMQVEEARNQERIKCLGEKVEHGFHSLRHEFGQAIALEGERRQAGIDSVLCYVKGTYVPGALVMPKSSICPSVMPEFNSWTAPTTTDTTTTG